MNKVYNQKGGTCVAFACANILERKTHIAPREKTIYAFYEKYTDGKGVTVRKLLDGWKTDGFGGVKIADYKLVWAAKGDKVRPSKARLYMSLKKGLYLAVVNVNKGIELDSNNFIIPKPAKRKHGVVLNGSCIHAAKFSLELENSWGKDFGDSGTFYTKLADLDQTLLEIWEVTF